MCHDCAVDDTYAGKLLIATPRLVDPNFYRTVVLMLQADDDGTVGVVLNRRTEEKIADHLPEWAEKAAPPGLIHFGGPVEPEVAIAISVGSDGMPTGVPGLCLVDISDPPHEDAPNVRVYSGYAGWSASQLEDEIAMGSWYVAQASPDDPFEDDPDEQWRRVLRRQPGYLSIVSTFPDDVSLN